MVICQEKTKFDSKAEYRNCLAKSNKCCLSKWYRWKASQDTQRTTEWSIAEQDVSFGPAPPLPGVAVDE